jgi:uncharacterized protein
MLTIGPAQKVTIYVNADVSSHVNFLEDDILQFLLKQGVAGASLFRVQAGFGARHRLHSQGAAGAKGEHLSVRIEFIDSKESVDAVLPGLCELVSDGVIEIQNTTIMKVATGKAELL